MEGGRMSLPEDLIDAHAERIADVVGQQAALIVAMKTAGIWTESIAVRCEISETEVREILNRAWENLRDLSWEDSFEELSVRTKNILRKYDFRTKEQVLKAYQANHLMCYRNFGKACHREVARWLGFGKFGDIRFLTKDVRERAESVEKLMGSRAATIYVMRKSGYSGVRIAHEVGISRTRAYQIIHNIERKLKDEGQWWHGLPGRVAWVLRNHGFKSKNEVLQVYKAGNLMRLRNFGWDAQKAVAKWLGFEKAHDPDGKICPHCGEQINERT